jgi:hypothetical protein
VRADQCVCVPPSLDHGRSACRPVVDHCLLWIPLQISPVGFRPGQPAHLRHRSLQSVPAPCSRRDGEHLTTRRPGQPGTGRRQHATGHPSRPAGARRQAPGAPPRAAATRAGRMPNGHHAPCREPIGRSGLRCTDLPRSGYSIMAATPHRWERAMSPAGGDRRGARWADRVMIGSCG